MGSIPIGTAIKIKFGFTEFYFYLENQGIEHMKHGIRTAAKRQTKVCRSPEVLTKGDFVRWRSIPIGTAKNQNTAQSGVFCLFFNAFTGSKVGHQKPYPFYTFTNFLKLIDYFIKP